MTPPPNAEDAPPPEERTLAARVKIYYDLFVPRGGDDEGAGEGVKPRPLLVALHGYGGSKRQMMREARRLAPDNFAVAALQGFHQHIREPKEPGGPLRYGFGWFTNFHPEEFVALHHKTTLELIDSLTGEGVADGARVFLLGFSQSGALNYRFAFTHTNVLRGVVGVCGGLPGDWDESGRYSATAADVLHLCGARDEFYPPARVADYERRLRTRARDVEVRHYDAGHEITPAMRADVRAWLRARAAT